MSYLKDLLSKSILLTDNLENQNDKYVTILDSNVLDNIGISLIVSKDDINDIIIEHREASSEAFLYMLCSNKLTKDMQEKLLAQKLIKERYESLIAIKTMQELEAMEKEEKELEVETSDVIEEQEPQTNDLEILEQLEPKSEEAIEPSIATSSPEEVTEPSILPPSTEEVTEPSILTLSTEENMDDKVDVEEENEEPNFEQSFDDIYGDIEQTQNPFATFNLNNQDSSETEDSSEVDLNNSMFNDYYDEEPANLISAMNLNNTEDNVEPKAEPEEPELEPKTIDENESTLLRKIPRLEILETTTTSDKEDSLHDYNMTISKPVLIEEQSKDISSEVSTFISTVIETLLKLRNHIISLDKESIEFTNVSSLVNMILELVSIEVRSTKHEIKDTSLKYLVALQEKRHSMPLEDIVGMLTLIYEQHVETLQKSNYSFTEKDLRAMKNIINIIGGSYE